MLEFRDVSKRYSGQADFAVGRLSLQLAPGEIVGLIGLNGAGKTTTLRIGCAVTLPSSGNVEVDGVDLFRQKAEGSRLIGWVPEAPFHDPASRVDALLRYYADIAGNVPHSLEKQLLDEWGMADVVRKRFRELSLGFRRRFAVVVASLTTPSYYLLDEPFNGLDPVALDRFRKWIQRTKTNGSGILLSSHNLREVQFLADRVFVIDRGRLISSMTSVDLTRLTHREVTVVLDRLDKPAIALMERFGEVSVTGTSVTVRGDKLEPGAVNVALVRAGYVVVRLSTGETDLEEHFLKLVGEAA